MADQVTQVQAPLSAAVLRQMNSTTRPNQIGCVVENTAKALYDAIAAAAKAGRTTYRWETALLPTEMELTSQERMDIKYRVKTTLIEKFPGVRITTDEPLSFVELEWSG